MPLEFQGNARPLTEAGMGLVTDKLSLKTAEIWAVLAVETSGCGFLPDRRPQILFERHIFHRLTNGEYDDGDISDPNPGGYGAAGVEHAGCRWSGGRQLDFDLNQSTSRFPRSPRHGIGASRKLAGPRRLGLHLRYRRPGKLYRCAGRNKHGIHG